MENINPPSKVRVGKSQIKNAGRGMFATASITKDQIIEICPVLETREEDYKNLMATRLRDYYFIWNDEPKKVALCLGYGALYNHSYEPNATYKKNIDVGTITFSAIKDIQADEEITVNYNYGNPDDKSKLWIDDIPTSNAWAINILASFPLHSCL